jgi:hypothetical protein
MRNISFALTTKQFLDGSKTVTRRLGWRTLRAGERLCACKKCMGLRRGAKIERLGEIEILSVIREPLEHIHQRDVVREGFPEMSPAEFVEMTGAEIVAIAEELRHNSENAEVSHDAERRCDH